MQHFKALKETTYGSRMVNAGEIVIADEDAKLDPTIWQAVPATHAQCTAAQQYSPVPMGMNTDPRVLNDYSKLEQENAGLRRAAVELTEQHAEMSQQLHGLHTHTAELQATIDRLQEQLANQNQLLADKDKEFSQCMESLQAENASLKKQLADAKKK